MTNPHPREEERRIAAWHEAGHAVVAHALGWRIHSIFVCSIGGKLDASINVTKDPSAKHEPAEAQSDDWLLERIKICYGGEFGQALKPAPVEESELQGDRDVTAMYKRHLCARNRAVELSALREQSRRIVHSHRSAVQAIAEALIDWKCCLYEVPGQQDDPHSIIRQAMRRSHPVARILLRTLSALRIGESAGVRTGRRV